MEQLIDAYNSTLSHKKAARICGIPISRAYKLLKGAGVIVTDNQRLAKIGDNNPNWSATNPTYRAVHQWVNRNKPKVKKCKNCGEEKPLDAANISGLYKRDILDFKWLCRACHMREDGRLRNLKQYAR